MQPLVWIRVEGLLSLPPVCWEDNHVSTFHFHFPTIDIRIFKCLIRYYVFLEMPRLIIVYWLTC